MKRNGILLALCLLVAMGVFAQKEQGFGLKAGLNYNGNGDFFDAAENIFRSPDRNIGYHVGVYGKFGTRLYLRPELIYTQTRSDYNEGELRLDKLDLPVLVGLKIIGPVHAFAGPAFQYILNSEFDAISFDNLDRDFTVGLHLGAGVNLGKLGVDLRYERGFSDNELSFINTNITNLNGDRVDTRPEQIILSLSLKL